MEREVKRALEWTQQGNPLSATETEMSPTNIKVYGTSDTMHNFAGLSKSSSGKTVFDGIVSNTNDWWFYSIGIFENFEQGVWLSNPAWMTVDDPAPGTLVTDMGIFAKRTTLSVFIPGIFIIITIKF